MKAELIRTEIMNLTSVQWQKVKEIEKVGFIEITVKALIDLIGFDGGMFFSGIANEREKKFIDEFYNYGRALTKHENDVLFSNNLPKDDYENNIHDQNGKEIPFWE